jgi:CRISPR/Cas system-associated exonuclease Cas4 (RecB family)
VLDEKIFVVPSYQIGHQIGESLAKNDQCWANLRFMTLPSLAHDVVGIELSKRKIKQITGAASLFLVEKIFRELKEEGELRYLGDLEISSGVVRSFRRSIAALRLAGMEAKDLEEGKFIGADKGREVILLLKRYEEALERGRFVDLAGVYRLAIEVLDTKTIAEAEYGRKYLCLQDQANSGLEKRFLEKLAGDRLILVPQRPVFGLEWPRRYWDINGNYPDRSGNGPYKSKIDLDNSKGAEEEGLRTDSDQAGEQWPRTDLERMAWLFAPEEAPGPFHDDSVDIFQAVGTTNECREVLRRIFHQNIPLDQVEIIHPPGDTYPSIFFVLSAKAGLKVTYADGVPLAFTAPGAVFRGLIDWIENNYQVTDLCRMIEGGSLKLSRKQDSESPSPHKISRYLKSAMIGWERERYLSRLESLRKGIESRAKLDEEDKENAHRKQAETSLKKVQWIENLLRQFFKLIPTEDEEGLFDLGLLCEGISHFIRKYSRIKDELDREALPMLLGRLNEVSQMAIAKVSRDEAFEWLRSLAEGISVGASYPMPGHIHLSSYWSGGHSGRGMTFVVGLDQSDFPGAGHQDPILLDEEREAISDDLPTSTDSLKEKLFAMGSLLASLRGKIVFSYSSYDIIEERQSFPSSLLLQVYRVVEGNPGLDYSALISALPEASGYLPEDLGKVFDEIDWWLSRLGSDGRLLDGRESIRRNFPDLNRGIEAVESRAAALLTWFDGVVAVDEREFNPVWNKDIVMSASRLELLATCPFSYFLQYVLGVRKPDELEYDQSRWLDALQRGSLLHKIFCRFMQELRKREESPSLNAHRPLIESIAEDIITQTKEEIPPPSEGIFAREKQELMDTLQVFLKSEEGREMSLKPVLFEAAFGMQTEKGEGMEEPAVIDVDKDHSLQLRGKIDRVDHIRENLYRVVDYKTGSYSVYDKLESFGRGRILQHALYRLAAEQILERLGFEKVALVIQSGYYFPTRRGEGKEVLVDEVDRRKLRELLLELIGILALGNFIVNPDVSCEYCDFVPVCPAEAPAKAKAKQEANPDAFSIFDRLKDYE